MFFILLIFFKKLKQNYIELCKKCDQLENENASYRKQHLNWVSSLEAKMGDFEQMRNNMDRQLKEIEIMKNKLEDESQMRQRLERELEESDKIKMMFNKLKIEYDLIKSKYDQQVCSNENLISKKGRNAFKNYERIER